MDQEKLYSTALEICGLTDEEALQLFADKSPGRQPQSIGSSELWELLADHYLKMQIVADQISIVTAVHDRDLTQIPMDEQASRFQPGSADRIHVMALLIALGMRDIDRDMTRRRPFD